MGRPSRLLAALALGLALAGTTTVAVAQPSPPTTGDLSAQRKALYESELEANLQPNRSEQTAVAEDHYDRLLRSQETEEARSARTDVAPTEAEQRQSARVREPYRPAEVPAAPAAPATQADPRPAVNVLASLLLGLAGGVVGGCAALAGWAATTRRRLRQPASAT
jgi:hypothetical protein